MKDQPKILRVIRLSLAVIGAMTGHRTGAGIGGAVVLPGILTGVAWINRHNCGVKVDQAILLAAVRVMTGIARPEIMEDVQVLCASLEASGCGGINRSSIRIVLVALEA